MADETPDNDAALRALAEASALEGRLAELLARELADHRRLTLEAMKALAGTAPPAPG